MPLITFGFFVFGRGFRAFQSLWHSPACQPVGARVSARRDSVMPASNRSKRVLLYSHDSYGLGHVSRCRTIANAIVEADSSISVLIISGSPVIGSYEFRSGIDFVRIPGVVKQISGEYDAANLRVVVDDPAQLAAEWKRKNVMPALRDLYDEIWAYGLPQVNKPLAGLDLPMSVRHKTVYTGYLRRELPLHTDIPHEVQEIGGPFILVTPGGGGDGEDLVDWVLSAYEADPNIPYGAVIAFGPFMSAIARERFKERASKFGNIRTLTFTNNLGVLMERAAGVVSMGGYNTFCEILSFDKRAIVVPRTHPRLEQFIRARAARNLGLIEMLDAEQGRDPLRMATALRQLPQQGLPSDIVVPGLLDGLGNVRRLVAKQLARPHRGPLSVDSVEQTSDLPTAAQDAAPARAKS